MMFDFLFYLFKTIFVVQIFVKYFDYVNVLNWCPLIVFVFFLSYFYFFLYFLNVWPSVSLPWKVSPKLVRVSFLFFRFRFRSLMNKLCCRWQNLEKRTDDLKDSSTFSFLSLVIALLCNCQISLFVLPFYSNWLFSSRLLLKSHFSWISFLDHIFYFSYFLLLIFPLDYHLI